MLTLEHKSDIKRMVHALKLSMDSACILLTVYNKELLRKEVESELKNSLKPEGFNFREYRVLEDQYKNLPINLVRMNPQPEDIFLIYDLRKALPEGLEYLNYRREDFVKHSISAIFWLDESTLVEIMRKAPDFFAFRALPIFEFKLIQPQELITKTQAVFDDGIESYTGQEIDGKIVLREEILQEYMQERPTELSTIARLHFELGELYRAKTIFTKAEFHLKKALNISIELSEHQPELFQQIVATILNSMGILHANMGHPDQALTCFTQALEIYRELAQKHPEAFQQYVATTLNNMGELHRIMGRSDDALICFTEALEIYRELAQKHPEAFQQYVAGTLNNMGALHADMGDPDQALTCYTQALEIRRELAQKHPEAFIADVAMTLNNIGNLHANMGHPDQALTYYRESLGIYHGLFLRYPSAYVRNFGIVLRGAEEVYQKLGLEDELKPFIESLQKFLETSEDEFIQELQKL